MVHWELRARSSTVSTSWASFWISQSFEEAGQTLDRMEAAENGVQRFGIGGLALQREDLGFDIGQVLAAFDDKIGDQLRVLCQECGRRRRRAAAGVERFLEGGDALLQSGLGQGVCPAGYPEWMPRRPTRRLPARAGRIHGFFRAPESTRPPFPRLRVADDQPESEVFNFSSQFARGHDSNTSRIRPIVRRSASADRGAPVPPGGAARLDCHRRDGLARLSACRRDSMAA